MADDKGLDIAIEPLNRFESDLVNTAMDVKKLIKDINHPRAKICLDGFHMAIEEQNMLQAIITAGEDLIHVQVSENYRGTPGTGTTNWNDIKMGLEQINQIEKLTNSCFKFFGARLELFGDITVPHMATRHDDMAI